MGSQRRATLRGFFSTDVYFRPQELERWRFMGGVHPQRGTDDGTPDIFWPALHLSAGTAIISMIDRSTPVSAKLFIAPHRDACCANVNDETMRNE